MPVDGGARPDPDPKDSAPDTDDALTDVLRAMQDAVEKRREPTSEKGDLFHRREAWSFLTRLRHHHWSGGAVGALLGALLGVIAVLLVDSQIARGVRYNFWLPAGIAMGLVGGGVIGLLFAEIWMGGHQDEEVTLAAKGASGRDQPE
jgi:hypothetical protein